MKNIRIIHLQDITEIQKVLQKIGVDPKGCAIMAPKGVHRLIHIKEVPAKLALILKQEMLSMGGEAAISKGTIDLTDSVTDVLLMGTLKHYRRLAQKLSHQYFGLSELAKDIEDVIEKDSTSKLVFRFCDKKFQIWEKTFIMGILNVTPDSFYDGGRYVKFEDAIRKGIELEKEGADIIDIGGESTRPGSKPISEEEEIKRVIPLIKELAGCIKCPISIDTYKAKVAEEALNAGAKIVNDISGLRFDERLKYVVRDYDAGLIIMHIQGTPQTMQENPYYDCVISELMIYFRRQLEVACESGINLENTVIDPGIGFGKTLEHNLKILKNLRDFKGLGRPILVGPSRKSFIGHILGLPPQERLEGTAAAVTLAINAGANLVRVHDVKEIGRLVKVADAILRG